MYVPSITKSPHNLFSLQMDSPSRISAPSVDRLLDDPSASSSAPSVPPPTGAPAIAAAGATMPPTKLPNSVMDRIWMKSVLICVSSLSFSFRVRAIQPAAASRITGMLVELSMSTAMILLNDPTTLRLV